MSKMSKDASPFDDTDPEKYIENIRDGVQWFELHLLMDLVGILGLGFLIVGITFLIWLLFAN